MQALICDRFDENDEPVNPRSSSDPEEIIGAVCTDCGEMYDHCTGYVSFPGSRWEPKEYACEGRGLDEFGPVHRGIPGIKCRTDIPEFCCGPDFGEPEY